MSLCRVSLAIWLVFIVARANTSTPGSRLHIRVFEIQSIQEIVFRWDEGGVPMIKLKGGDASYPFPEEGMVFHSHTLQAEAKGTVDYLRAKYPETPLGESLAIGCIFDERNIIFSPDGASELYRQLAFDEGKTLALRIELKKMLSPFEAALRIRLSIKLKSKKREVIDCECIWDTSKQLYVGYPSHLGEGRKGNVYFVTFFYDAST